MISYEDGHLAYLAITVFLAYVAIMDHYGSLWIIMAIYPMCIFPDAGQRRPSSLGKPTWIPQGLRLQVSQPIPMFPQSGESLTLLGFQSPIGASQDGAVLLPVRWALAPLLRL